MGYDTDITDAEWTILESHVPAPKPGGRRITYERRAILNGIFYILRTGAGWRHMPHDLPPWGSVYHYFWEWRNDGTWHKIHDLLRDQLRGVMDRDAHPTAAIIDSQSVKTTDVGGDERGYDNGKQIAGRKRHILVDTQGLVLALWVHAADLQDRDGAKVVFEKAQRQQPRLERIWADGAYAGKLEEWVTETCGWMLDIVKRSDDMKGFVVLPRRWVVERTFGWFAKNRRLSKDYERQPETSESWIYLTMLRVMLKRLAHF